MTVCKVEVVSPRGDWRERSPVLRKMIKGGVIAGIGVE
jgi:hypothetical protein